MDSAFFIMQLRKQFWHLSVALLLAGAASVVMVTTASFLYLAPRLPPAEDLRKVSFQIPLRVYSREGLLIGEFGEHRRNPIAFEDLPPLFIKAVLAAEDRGFFQHNGVSLRGLLRAALELARYREIRSGGSTITMQVARNFFLVRDQTFLRKFNEIVLALQIERILTKEEILVLYLNKIFLGYRSYGAEAAAQVYYGKSLSELNLAQWAMIAGLPKAPSAFNPIANPDRAILRRNWILDGMLEAGFIDRAEHANARSQPTLATLHTTRPEVSASYMAEMARQEVVNRYGAEAYVMGLRVHTTLQASRQQAARSALRRGIHDYDERHGWRGAERAIDTRGLPAIPVAPDERSVEDIQAWAATIGELKPVAELEPAVVALTDDTGALLITPEGKTITLPFAAMQWAAAYIDADTTGSSPAAPSDILEPGDVVRIRPWQDEESSTWRLAQIPAVQGAIVSIDPRTGAIEALQGGYSFSLSQFNRTTDGLRQTGSAFKPFIYSAGLRHGMTPATIINDAPVVFQDAQLEATWRPTGASSRFYGPTRLREALYRSLNLVSIRILQRIGISNALETFADFNLPIQRFPRDLSLALGSATMTPLEVATGYAAFANNGHPLDSWFIERIETDEGILFEAPGILLCQGDCDEITQKARENAQQDTPEPHLDTMDTHETDNLRTVSQRLDSRDMWLMDSMLKDVIKRGTATRARELQRTDLAGKTGTTNEYLDAWFVGYTPLISTAVWIGFDEPVSLGRGEYGGRAALPVWIDYMAQISDEIPEMPLEQPAGILSTRINPITGERVRPGSNPAIFEHFRADNLPPLEPEGNTGGDRHQTENSTAPESLF